ncbi:MAG: thiamine ABC transporter substrate-binding protein [Candidatus Thorarchaeota archaeon]
MSQKITSSIMIILLTINLPVANTLFFTNNHSIQGISSNAKVLEFNAEAENELVIYTHESFLTWGLDPEASRYTAFEKFALEKGVSIRIYNYNGMVDALNDLIREKDNPRADLVIGLDNTMVARAKTEGILEPYTEVNLDNISTSLVNSLDPEKYLLPIDYSLLAFVFDTEFINTTSYSELSDLSFELLNSTFAEDLVVQDPTLSATGLNFLLYQIVFYEEILHLDWTIWWETIKDKLIIDSSWSASWDRVFTTKESHMMVSYATDPAYNAYFNYSFEKNAEIIHYNSQKYGWLQIEGIGIVNGTDDLALAKEFIDHSLNGEFQDLIAVNNWMFPANQAIVLPPCYSYAITPEDVIILNDYLTPTEIGDNYLSWLNEWEEIVYGTGLWWLWVTIPSSIILIAILVAVPLYLRSKRLNID